MMRYATTADKVAAHAERRLTRLVRTAARIVHENDIRRGCNPGQSFAEMVSVYRPELRAYVQRELDAGTPAIQIPRAAARKYEAE